MIKIGILSFAHHHSEAYIHNLRQLEGVELIGVADEDLARGQRFAELYATRSFASYADLLEARPHGVIICAENSKHRLLAEMAASLGIHVLSEKPLATRLEDAAAMLQACERAGVLLMTAFPMRFSAPLLEIKQRLDQGDFGRVYCFNAVNQGELPTRHRAWFVDPQLAGGGAIMDHTVHLVDIMRWYLGSEASSVYARSNRVFHADLVQVETGALEMITFTDGVFASIDASWSRPPYWPTWGGLAFEMVSERGAVIVDGFKQNLTVYSHAAQRPQWAYWGSDMNQAMIADFVAAVRDQRPPRVSGWDGYRALEVTLAAYESARLGQAVQLSST